MGQVKDIEYIYFKSDLGIYSLIEDSIYKKVRLHDLMIRKVKEGIEFEKVL